MSVLRCASVYRPGATIADLPEGPFLILWALRTLYHAPDGETLVRYEFDTVFGRDDTPLVFAALGATWNALRFGQRRGDWSKRVPSAERVSDTEGLLIRLLSVALHKPLDHLQAYADYLMWPEIATGCANAAECLVPLLRHADLDWPKDLTTLGFAETELEDSVTSPQAFDRRPSSVASAP